MSDLTSTSAVIDVLGGTGAVSRLTGKSLRAVSNWKRDDRAKFPADTFLVMQSALTKKGLKATPLLWGIEPPQKRRSAA